MGDHLVEVTDRDRGIETIDVGTNQPGDVHHQPVLAWKRDRKVPFFTP